MKDGSMFGTLKNVLTKEWQNIKKNHIINLITERGIIKYKVFSVYSINNENYYIKTNFTNEKSFEEFINKIKNRSIYNFEKIDNYNSILTLSTCDETGRGRVVLHAMKTS